jgi:hypothetical protein
MVSVKISCKILNSKVLAHLGFKSKVLPGYLTDMMFKILQRNAILWDILYYKNSNVIPGMSVFIGHA